MKMQLPNMTPSNPSSSDGSALPSRHRPNLDKLSKITTEEKLWELDDAEGTGQPPPDDPPRPLPYIPEPRDGQDLKPRPPETPAPQSLPKLAIGKDQITVNVGKNRPKIRSTPTVNSRLAFDRDFEDLDRDLVELGSWDEPQPVAAAAAMDSSTPPFSGEAASQEAAEPAVAEVAPAVEVAPVAEVAAVATDDREEFSVPRVLENARRVTIPQLGLSKVERLGLLALLALLAIGGGIIFINTISRLPNEADLVQSRKFPVKGERITIEAAQSFWRAPVVGSDTFRRGTELLPVASITTRGGPAALRVFFRDSAGQVVGDAVNHSVGGAGTFEVAATAGFEESWMHDTYRTARDKPWTIELLEGPSQAAPAGDFKTLLEMKISPERR